MSCSLQRENLPNIIKSINLLHETPLAELYVMHCIKCGIRVHRLKTYREKNIGGKKSREKKSATVQRMRVKC